MPPRLSAPSNGRRGHSPTTQRRAVPFLLLTVGWGLMSSVAHGETKMMQLPSGARLLVKENRSNRILAIECFFNVGSSQERAEENGVANLMCRSLLKGTRKRSALQIAQTMESIGGDIDASAAEDFVNAGTISTVDDYGVALDVLSDVILNPTFPADEVEKEREVVLAGIRQREDDSFGYTYREFRELLYKGHPYAMPVSGTPESVKAITREQIEEFHRRHITAANLLVVVVGDVQPEQVARTVDQAFSALPAGGAPRILVSKEFRPRQQAKTLNKEIEQAFLIVGFVTDRAVSNDYAALKVASALLGSGMSSRLFVRLRDKQGLAYAVGSAIPTLRDKSHFFAYIGTKPESVEAARDGLLDVIDSLTNEPIPPDELERTKNHMIGQFRIAHQRNSDQATYMGVYEMAGLGWQFDSQYPDRIRQVTAEQVKAVAQKYFRSPTITTLRPREPQTKEAQAKEATEKETKGKKENK